MFCVDAPQGRRERINEYAIGKRLGRGIGVLISLRGKGRGTGADMENGLRGIFRLVRAERRMELTLLHGGRVSPGA